MTAAPVLTIATPFLLWGIVFHLIVDWLFQSEWMAANKASRRVPKRLWQRWWDGRNHGTAYISEHGEYPKPPQQPRWWVIFRHPAAYVHALPHGLVQLLVFPWWAALIIGVTHLLIDTRTFVAWWSKLIRQTQPAPSQQLRISREAFLNADQIRASLRSFDIGSDVRIWVDQVAHIAVLAVVALLVTV
jgi:hypothetical protein